MNKTPIHEGVLYRAARSKMSCELLKALIDSMRIERISRYQPYNVFVQHRLERAYVLLQAIDLRYEQISAREAELRARLARDGTLKHEAIISALQWNAELAFFFIVAPY